MKKNKLLKMGLEIVLMLISISLIFGCEDVITYNLDNAESQVVIEASIMDNPGSGIVQISWSADYFNPDNFESINNALVEIKNEEGDIYNLIEEMPGIYKTNNLSIDYNQKYDLKIVSNDITYNASTTLAKPIIIDSLSYSFESFFGEDYCDVYINFQDPPESNDYAIVYFRYNNKDFESPILYEDRLTNGNYFKEALLQISKDSLVNGSNTVEFLMRAVDKDTYNYYQSLLTVLASDENSSLFSPSSPENPKSNFNNNVLGYFGGYSISKKTIEIIIN